MNTKVDSRIKIAVDWEASFFADLKKEGRSERTLAAYGYDLIVYAAWFERENKGVFGPEFLTTTDLQTYREYSLKVEKVKPATWNRRKAFLGLLVKWARSQGMISYDAMYGVGTAEAVQQAPRWLEKDEFRRLMRQVELNMNAANTEIRKRKAVRDGVMVNLMVFAGLREGEVCALQGGDIALGDRSGKCRVRLGKGEKMREVPFSLEVRKALQIWLTDYPNQDPSSRLIGEAGKSLTEREIQLRIRALGQAAGIEDLTPHRLRHTCAKRMLDAGRPLTEVQMILGHAKLETTARYVQPGWADLTEAVDSISRGS